jgi:hypothetical protein
VCCCCYRYSLILTAIVFRLEPKSTLKRKLYVPFTLSIQGTLLICWLHSQAEPSGSKKGKKALKNTSYALGTEDEIAKAKRARRFEREHEIERQRARAGGLGFRVDPEPSYAPYNHSTGHITQGVGSMSLEPGYDPVSIFSWKLE